MRVDITCAILIRRPLAEVADYAADPDNAPSWYVDIQSAEWVTRPPLSVGSRIAFRAHFLGRRLRYVYEVVEFVPRERLVMRTAEGPFPMETGYSWRGAAEGATRMTLTNRGTPAGFSRLAAPLLAFAMRRANRKDLRRLKRLLECGPAGAPAAR